MKHLFLLNPVAGQGRDLNKFRAEILSACAKRGLQEDRDYEIFTSQKPRDITKKVAEAVKTGEELRLYACGGDGTLNETVAGAAGHSHVSVTNVARGSGNDFIRMFTDTAPFRSIEALLDDPKETPVDLICCNGEYAINVCSTGLDARIGTEVATYKRLPLVKGHGAYLLSSLVNTIKGVHRHYRVEIDGQMIDGEQTMIYVGNGAWYGGGFNPVPEADPTDGLLDVLMVTGVSRMTVLKVIGPYKQGKYRDYPHLMRHFRTDKVKILCDEDEPINLDGELRMGKEAEFAVAPFQLRFFYPKEVSLQNSKAPVGAGSL